MNVVDVLKYGGGIKQDSDFDSILIDSIHSHISEGYHITEYNNKEYTEDLHGITLENKVFKTVLSNHSDSTVEITAFKNQLIRQITVFHTSKTDTKPNGWCIKTSTTTLECTQ